ncbi:MAG: pyrophosphatase [Flavobacteriales bacterium]|nr:pyrophosphatase [Flavobacteriales bacterium]|tara:strand:+ start:3588 stop:3923 length:336 start_codon:yes stop_codon:yes gene_type:complete
MTIKEVQQKIDDWIKKYGVRYFSELTNMALLTEEVGELSRHIARIYGEQNYKKEVDGKMLIKEEIGDIFFVLVCLCNQMNIDLKDCLLNSLEKKTGRDSERHLKNKKLTNG